MSKHTPGSWDVFHKHKYDEWHVSVPVSGSSMRLGLFNNGIRSENPEADARLIAAAPDMLRALEMVLDADNDCKSDGLQTMPDIARAIIELTIAKAKGGAA